MSWDNGTIGGLLAGEQYKAGRIGPEPLKALVATARGNQPAADQPVPHEITLATPVSGWDTTQTLVSAAGRLYKVRIENLSADPVFAIFADNVIAQVIAAVTVPARISSTVPSTVEATFFQDPHVTGERFLTSLLCRMFKIDGTGSTAAAAGQTVKVLVG